jgi:signal transduction histidine kinase
MQNEKITIMYVDDEENNLNSFRAWFRKDYEIYIAKSAEEAFRILEHTNPHIFIADQRMPNTTGIEFLEQTIESFPDSIRLLITGQSDIQVVIEAINRGQVSKYIAKPWQWDKLQLTLENCAMMYKSKIELKTKNVELQKLNEELNKFVYSISHDVRAPLMSILGIVNLSKMTETSEMTKQYFDMIEGSVNKLDVYLRNIIEYYKNSRTDQPIEQVDFHAFMHELVDTNKMQDPSVEFKIEVKQKETFHADLFRLRIILTNLLTNAIRYKKPNSTDHVVELSVISNESMAILKIRDNGVGIMNEHLDDIFQLFFRSRNASNNYGSGIGLYIVKEALNKIGGTIQVSSKPMEFTEFMITINNQPLAS